MTNYKKLQHSEWECKYHVIFIPKYRRKVLDGTSVAPVVGYIKGKSAIHIARHFGERRRNFVGQHFWARGYFVSTVGRDEEVIRRYIQRQENEERKQDQLKFG